MIHSSIVLKIIGGQVILEGVKNLIRALNLIDMLI